MRVKLISIPILISFCLFPFYSGFTQSDTHASSLTIPEDIVIAWKVETNFLEDGSRYRAVLTLKNDSDTELPDSGWSLYFNYLGVIDSKTLPKGVHISLINGNFYKLEPTDKFNGIPAGEEFVIPFEAPGSKIKEGDAPSGLYFVDHVTEQTVPVSEIAIAPFTEEEQLKRGPSDNLPTPDAKWRYKKNASLSKLSAERVGQITPTPASVEKGNGTFEWSGSIEIGYQQELAEEAQFLSEQLAQVFSGDVSTVKGTSLQSDILLKLNSDSQKAESYELSIATDQINISGADPSGVFYGIQSLRALIPPEAYQEPQSSVKIDAQHIEDAPRFGYRGMHLDVARNFQSASSVKKLLDVISFYKLNTFHFHLTDDEGWRLPVEPLPELTEVGGRRGHTVEEQNYLMPSYGSGPNPDPDESQGSGWYDRETFIEILRYAKERHIEVIPEIDVPGHARAAIVAMKSRYDKLKAEGDVKAANRYRLHEPEDESQYRSVQNWDDNVINVCQRSTYRFMETVIDEIVTMYEEADAPLSTIHMGGDEVPHSVWEQSPACRELIRNTSLDDVDDLPDYFFERLRQILAERDLAMAGWEEIAFDESDGGPKPDPDFAGFITPYVWASMWGSGTEDHAYKLANAGYEVIMSHASNFYFDLAYSHHPKEPGLYWAGFVDTKDPYSFIPYDLYKNADKNTMGNPIAEDVYNDAIQLTDEGHDNILGLQGQLWSEKLISADRMEYMAMPRLVGLAERAWAKQPPWATIEDRGDRKKQMNENWNKFANRLGQYELQRMDYFHGGVHYRIPPPGVVVEGDTLKANVAYPGLPIRYTLDGTKPTEQSTKLTEPIYVGKNAEIKLRTFSTNGRGSRTVTVQNM